MVNVAAGMCDNSPGAWSGSDVLEGGGVGLEEMASSNCLSVNPQDHFSYELKCMGNHTVIWETSIVKDPKCVSDN